MKIQRAEEDSKRRQLRDLRIPQKFWDRVEKITMLRDRVGRAYSYDVELAAGVTYNGEQTVLALSLEQLHDIIRYADIGEDFVPKKQPETAWRKIDWEGRQDLEQLCRREKNISIIAEAGGFARNTVYREFRLTDMDAYTYDAAKAQEIMDRRRRQS